uniref:Uncharacterized protein n=1 Tax=Chromera velia CCMP2878 TaxID=1169474 RepID=A0A0G4F6J1_9ALVE|eukprot:Cvel_15343.t1-p1 / transcript=Cvel_15343.t1 / gene=Cvel_15343 / organism=Chromera_velia_CCMP2878 / gene_product=hypothetical protein / transcript_product=hypothetical protein / location=Cvel_scaffold1129:33215-34010(-) / protein_length=200 / sequence_SO=supercontig / SO=protein_coding / is_pseudo=false
MDEFGQLLTSFAKHVEKSKKHQKEAANKIASKTRERLLHETSQTVAALREKAKKQQETAACNVRTNIDKVNTSVRTIKELLSAYDQIFYEVDRLTEETNKELDSLLTQHSTEVHDIEQAMESETEVIKSAFMKKIDNAASSQEEKVRSCLLSLKKVTQLPLFLKWHQSCFHSSNPMLSQERFKEHMKVALNRLYREAEAF